LVVPLDRSAAAAPRPTTGQAAAPASLGATITVQATIDQQAHGRRIHIGEVFEIEECDFRPTRMVRVTEAAPARDLETFHTPPMPFPAAAGVRQVRADRWPYEHPVGRVLRSDDVLR
jgi:hypothetical protein